MPRSTALATHIVMISALVLWGGIGSLNAPDAPEIAGVVRIQDTLSGIGGLVLLLLSTFQSHKKTGALAVMAFVGLLLYGVAIGLLNNNELVDIAFEARILLYMILGLLVGFLVNDESLDKLIAFYAMLVALAILAQWLLMLSGSQASFVHGVNPGNIFTGNIPLVRPSSFHLVGAGTVLAISPWKPRPVRRLYILLLLFVLVVIQSKTYWVLLVIGVLVNFVVNAAYRKISSKLVSLSLSLVCVSLAVGALLVLMLSRQTPEVIRAFVVMPYEKFKGILTDQEITYGVIGKRLDETAYMVQEWTASPLSVVFGRGLGFLYRDPALLFYRANPRDAERLAMFGHNFYLWLLLKFGLVGTLMFLWPVSMALVSAVRGPQAQKHFGLGLVSLLISSMVLGVAEEPTGAFLVGLLIAGTLEASRDGALVRNAGGRLSAHGKGLGV